MILHFSEPLKLCLKTESPEKEQWWLFAIVLVLTLSCDVFSPTLHRNSSKLCSKFLLHLKNCVTFAWFCTDEENGEGLLHLGPRIGGVKTHRPIPTTRQFCSIDSHRSTAIVFGDPLLYFTCEPLGLTFSVYGNPRNYSMSAVKGEVLVRSKFQ